MTPEFLDWFETKLNEDTQDDLDAAIELLRQQGPGLGRPKVDTLTGSTIANLKELRVSSIRVLFAFDPERSAVLLLGGDKAGQWSKWYRGAIREAERLWKRHIEELEGENEGGR
ncbi:type II toxin-antitoxin system RelE/ParE family toxin [Klenkia sp. PcliD-1-E]|uniref:type II toxin-antitoxin system RelE/ParE family toxin n=1 Tax=Klenkia sp. PcliD-1-E TaxID=2954492 RepID=UPI002096828E|nr:type II toxin-antitoxin system RelE/ParE family toxin [Klenkia sp. PcliD-1-E]MCO7220400.1 type II toxin-antitoxin system RelE/ParE family toxin [Klenkia sp. PcliD-1-E]